MPARASMYGFPLHREAVEEVLQRLERHGAIAPGWLVWWSRSERQLIVDVGRAQLLVQRTSPADTAARVERALDNRAPVEGVEFAPVRRERPPSADETIARLRAERFVWEKGDLRIFKGGRGAPPVEFPGTAPPLPKRGREGP